MTANRAKSIAFRNFVGEENAGCRRQQEEQAAPKGSQAETIARVKP